jgi:gamma-glutamyltranspeptidase/glutathione hydrolase
MTPPRVAGGIVVSPHPAASEAGAAVLRAGGNAVDAAIAANAVLAVVYCHSCGLGGDAFALVWHPTDRRLYGYNGSGRAPACLSADLIKARGFAEVPARGPLPITVPGAVDAWQQLASRFGTQSFGDLFADAIRVAEDGTALTALSARRIADSAEFLNASAREVFLEHGAPKAGDVLRQPLLARTLRALADDGGRSFYKGDLAAEIVRAVGDAGGVLSREDLRSHRGEWVDPIEVTYQGARVATMPPNSQGITALIALNVLGALDPREWADLPASARLPAGAALPPGRVHAQVEALKAAWEDRDRCIGDPDQMDCVVQDLLSVEHASDLAGRLDPRRAARFSPRTPPGGGTVYLTAADRGGMVVGLIQSNWMGFGSGVMGGTTGVMLHNRGNYFELAPSRPNSLAPGVRPLHTLSPVMLLREDTPFASLGAMGGDGQPQFMVQLINALVDDKLDPQQAVDRPRWIVAPAGRGQPLRDVSIERDGVDAADLAALQDLGHRVTATEPRSSAVGWAQIITCEPNGGYSAGADPRADSLAVGV